MRDAPSAELIDLLSRLGLATPQEVRSVRRFAQTLARDVPLFDSVWVDALMRRRILTPFQAAEINAGRGEQLALGPAVLLHPPARLGHADQYVARLRASGEIVQVVVASLASQVSTTAAILQLTAVAEQLQRAQQAEIALAVLPLSLVGSAENRIWIVQPQQADLPLGECLLRGGRLRSDFVLEIARQMAAELASLEQFSLVHGDISSASIRLHESGQVHLAQLGLRSIVRPGEGYAHADLSPAAYDYLAPERVASGTAANVSSDLYACGCLWWQLLTGRPPLSGGDSLARIKSAHAARIVPVCRLAPEAPALLTTIIARLTQCEPGARGSSFAELSEALGPSQPDARRALAAHVAQLRPQTKRTAQVAAARDSRAWFSPAIERLRFFPAAGSWASFLPERRSLFRLSVTGCLLFSLLATWLAWSGRGDSSPAGSPAAVAQQSQAASDPPGLLAVEMEQSATPIVSANRHDTLSAGNPLRQIKSTKEAGAAGIRHASLDMPADEASPGVATFGPTRKPFLPVREIQLPADRIVSATTLELHPGIRLAPAAGSRARIQVPPGGWEIDVDDVRVENVDFVSGSLVDSAIAVNPAMILLKASSAQFHGCSFQVLPTAKAASQRLSAVHWVSDSRTAVLDQLPAAGHLLFANCFLANLHTGVDCRRLGPVVLELDNVLVVSSGEAAQAGPLWRLDRCPASEDTVVLRMNACTIRDTMSLIDVYCPELPTDPGRLQLETTDCVFAARSTGALLRMIGPFRPDRLLRTIAWSGRGSLLPVQGRFGLWYDAQGAPHNMDDTSVEIDGLVRGGVEFAGPSGVHPQESMLTHWSAPLIGDARPGVRISALPAAK